MNFLGRGALRSAVVQFLMSLTDPVAARREKQARQRAKGWTAFPVIVPVVLVFVPAIVGFVVRQARSGTSETFLTSVPTIAIPVLMLTWVPLCLRRGLSPGLGFGLGIVGVGLGLLFAGTVDQRWSILVCVAGLLLTTVGCVATFRRRSARRRSAQIRATGWETVATMTEAPVCPSEGMAANGRATFRFTDAHDTTRWVQRSMLVRHGEQYPIGTTTRLWAPIGEIDERKIVVELVADNPPFGW